MEITRRHVAIAGALALGVSSLGRSIPAFAESADAAAVAQAIEALRRAMLAADRAQLEALAADQLSYGHSGGVIQSKKEFVDVIVTKKTVYKSITLSDPTLALSGNDAIARHTFAAETETDGKASTAKIGVLQVWQKQRGKWRLLARQAFKT